MAARYVVVSSQNQQIKHGSLTVYVGLLCVLSYYTTLFSLTVRAVAVVDYFNMQGKNSYSLYRFAGGSW